MAALASVPVYAMSLSEHNAFHTILTEMQDGKKNNYDSLNNMINRGLAGAWSNNESTSDFYHGSDSTRFRQNRSVPS